MLQGKTVILGVTGGIAAYKAASLCSLLVKQRCKVHVVMTPNACNFITPLTFETLSNNKCVVDTFEHNSAYEVEHISLADQADLVLIAPATADVLAKCAHGLADDMLTTTVLACDCPKLAVPAMNTRMYENPVTQNNLKLLRDFGWSIMEPVSGRLACGAVGTGKMPEPEDILETVIHQLSHSKDMEGIRILVTAGPTRESLDPVRYITNHSSGLMGYSIAAAAAARGAKVTLVSGVTNLKAPAYVETIDVVSAKDMFEAVTARSGETDIIIKAAAVADYRPAKRAEDKIKKSDSGSDLMLELERTDDILAYLGQHKAAGQVLCGFSMETKDLLENSRAKLEKKNLDMICANNLKEPGAGFGVSTNVLTLISREMERALPLMSKGEASHILLDELLSIYRRKNKA